MEQRRWRAVADKKGENSADGGRKRRRRLVGRGFDGISVTKEKIRAGGVVGGGRSKCENGRSVEGLEERQGEGTVQPRTSKMWRDPAGATVKK